MGLEAYLDREDVPADVKEAIKRNITDRKKIEEEIKDYTKNLEKFVEERTLELKESEAHLQQLLTTSPAVIYSCEPVGDYAATFISENIKSQLGYEPWEFLGDPKFWADHIHPEDAPRVFTELSRLFDHDYHIHEYRFQHKNGTYRWMHDELRLLRDAKGNPQEIVGYWIDITERKRVETKLHASEERFRGLYESSIDGIFFSDVKKNITDCNQSLADMLGYTQEELCEMTMWQVTPSKWYDMINKFISKQVITSGFSDVYEQEVIKKDGMIIPVSVRVRLLKDKDGKPTGRWGLVRDITEQKKLEACLKDYTENLERMVNERTMELKESEERYRGLFNSTIDSIVSADTEGTILDCNQAFIDMHGYTKEEICQLKMQDLLQDKWNEKVAKMINEQLIPYGYSDEIEIEGIKKDGTVFPISIRSWVTKNKEGRPLEIWTIAHDITERKRAEKTLIESEERYRGLYESSRDGIVSIDTTGKFTECNQAYADMLGYTKEELYNLALWDILPSEEYDRVKKIITEQVFQRGYFEEFESVDIKKDGTIVPISIRSWLIKDKDGNPTGIWAIVRDITERKRAEEVLKASEERYRGLYESSMDGIVSVDIEGNIVECNQAYADMIDYTKEEVSNFNYLDLMPRKWHEMGTKILPDLLKWGYSDEMEIEGIKKDGTVFPASIRVWLIKDREGKPTRSWTIIRDITKRKQLESQLNKYAENLEELVDERTLQLKESEERYRGLYESSMDGIISIDMEGNIVECNQAFSNCLGYTKEELYELNYEELTPEKWHDMDAKILAEQMFIRGYSEAYEKEYIKKDGRIFPVSIREWLIKNKDGTPTGMWAIVRDVTENKKLEKELKQYTKNLEKSETRYRSLYEASIDGVVFMDMNENILECNQAFSYMLGYTKDELHTLNFRELIPDKWSDIYEKIFAEKVLLKNNADIYEIEFIKKDGTIISVSVRGWIIKDKDDTPMYGWAIVRDSTERKQAEENLKQCRDELKQILKER